jgi:hypothetical protein
MKNRSYVCKDLTVLNIDMWENTVVGFGYFRYDFRYLKFPQWHEYHMTLEHAGLDTAIKFFL